MPQERARLVLTNSNCLGRSFPIVPLMHHAIDEGADLAGELRLRSQIGRNPLSLAMYDLPPLNRQEVALRLLVAATHFAAPFFAASSSRTARSWDEKPIMPASISTRRWPVLLLT